MTATLDKFARLAALKPTRRTSFEPTALRAPDQEDHLSRLLGAGITSNHFGEHVAVRNWYSTPEFAEPSPMALDLLTRQRDESLSRRARNALADSSKWLFLDTETTGLAGGTGTYAFLVGLAWWDADGLEVEQLLMRDFSEEHSVLYELALRAAERPVLVTFNGKTFDWPLLENRFTMTRSIPPPKLAAHLDLLHPARALWKLRLGSVRLAELERKVLDPARLGWTRDDDVPSSLIPQFYFDYLRGGPPGPLAGVVRHNQMDLRGLAALFGKINGLLSEQGKCDAEALDLFGLSRFLQRKGETERAHSACAEAIDIGLPAAFWSEARREFAAHAKRRGDHAHAATILQDIAGDPREGAHACEQLAIYYERRAKDLNTALEYAQLALVNLRRRYRGSRNPGEGARFARNERSFLKRIERLQHRIRLDCERVVEAPLLGEHRQV
jgi:uncharacterized protein YprB with RNaseH-like and TPR domain